MKWVYFLLLLTSISALDLTQDPYQFTNILKTELTYGTDPRHEPEFDAIVSYNTGTPDSGYTDNSWTLPPPGNVPTETYDGSYGDIMTRAECVAWGKRTFESSFTGIDSVAGFSSKVRFNFSIIKSTFFSNRFSLLSLIILYPIKYVYYLSYILWIKIFPN